MNGTKTEWMTKQNHHHPHLILTGAVPKNQKSEPGCGPLGRVLHGIPKAEPATNRRGRWAFEVKRRPLPLF